MKIDKVLSLVGLAFAVAGLGVLVAGRIRYGTTFSLRPPQLILLLFAVGACLRSLLKKRRPR